MNQNLKTLMNLIDKNSDKISESDYLCLCNEMKALYNHSKNLQIFKYDEQNNTISEESLNILADYNNQVTCSIVCDELYLNYLNDYKNYKNTKIIPSDKKDEYIEKCTMLYCIDNSLKLESGNFNFTNLKSKFDINISTEEEFIDIMFPKLKRLFKIMIDSSNNKCNLYWNQLSSTKSFEALLSIIQDTCKCTRWFNEYHKIINNSPRYLHSTEHINGNTIKFDYEHIVPYSNNN